MRRFAFDSVQRAADLRIATSRAPLADWTVTRIPRSRMAITETPVGDVMEVTPDISRETSNVTT